MADVVDAVLRLLGTHSIVSKADVIKDISNKWSVAWVDRTVGLGINKGYLINDHPESQKPGGRQKYALCIGANLPESDKWRKGKAYTDYNGFEFMPKYALEVEEKLRVELQKSSAKLMKFGLIMTNR